MVKILRKVNEMTNKEFVEIVNKQLRLCQIILTQKGNEYGSKDDRLIQLTKHGELNGIHPANAAWQLGCKHLVSISEMTKDPVMYPIEVWDEKITDAINYLLLIKATIVEGSL